MTIIPFLDSPRKNPLWRTSWWWYGEVGDDFAAKGSAGHGATLPTFRMNSGIMVYFTLSDGEESVCLCCVQRIDGMSESCEILLKMSRFGGCAPWGRIFLRGIFRASQGLT